MIDTIWIILGVITLILLVLYWNNRNAVWGGLVLGIITGFVVTIFFVFKRSTFNGYTIGKLAIIGVLLGFVAELLGILSNYLRKRT